MGEKRAKRDFKLCEYSEEQTQFIRVMKERHGLTYTALARMGMSLLMKQYRVDIPEKKNE